MFPSQIYLRHKDRVDLDRSGSAFEVSVAVEVLSPDLHTRAAYVSFLNILDLTNGSHKRLASGGPKLVGYKALQRIIVGEYLLCPRGIYSKSDNVRIIGPRCTENAVLDHSAYRQPIIVGRRHVMHQICFVTMKQKKMH